MEIMDKCDDPNNYYLNGSLVQFPTNPYFPPGIILCALDCSHKLGIQYATEIQFIIVKPRQVKGQARIGKGWSPPEI